MENASQEIPLQDLKIETHFNIRSLIFISSPSIQFGFSTTHWFVIHNFPLVKFQRESCKKDSFVESPLRFETVRKNLLKKKEEKKSPADCDNGCLNYVIFCLEYLD